MVKLPIDHKDTSFTPLLENLQANILKHHGRRFAWHLFLQFKKEKAAAIKAWIGTYAAGNGDIKITNAYKQLKDVEGHRIARANNIPHDAGTVSCFFLAAEGYKALGISPYMPGVLPPGVNNGAFAQGLKSRGPGVLHDPAVKYWEEGFRDDIHAMLLLADEDEANLQMLLSTIRVLAEHITYGGTDAAAMPAGINTNPAALFKTIHVQKGEELKDAGLGIEHFGYADGVSQPTFLKGEIKAGKVWDDNEKDISTLLVPETVQGAIDCYGSYLVFRKLEQNVKAFKELEEEIGKKLFPNLPKEEEDLAEIAGAYVVGRFEDGSPVTRFDREQPAETEDPTGKGKEKPDNDFTYKQDTEGSRCPFHAHIRMTNPRDRSIKDFTRISRRGITYDEAGRNGNLHWFPEGGVGLLFMCYQGSIENQFEVIQGKWANKGDILANNPTGIDGVIGQGPNAHQQWWPLSYNGEDRVKLKNPFAGFVTMKGGEYFYAPSIPFLAGIDKL